MRPSLRCTDRFTAIGAKKQHTRALSGRPARWCPTPSIRPECLLHTRRRVLSRECSRHGFRDPPSGGTGGGGARTAIILSFIVVTGACVFPSVVPSSHVRLLVGGVAPCRRPSPVPAVSRFPFSDFDSHPSSILARISPVFSTDSGLPLGSVEPASANVERVSTGIVETVRARVMGACKSDETSPHRQHTRGPTGVRKTRQSSHAGSGQLP